MCSSDNEVGGVQFGEVPGDGFLGMASVWELVSENMQDIAWLMDMGFRTTWVTASGPRLRGFTFEELAEMPLQEQLAPESLARAQALIAENLTQERLADPSVDITVSALLEFRCKDGSSFWGDTIITLLRDEEGVAGGMLGVARDVGARLGVEADLQENQRRMATLIGNLPGIAYRCRNNHDWTMEFISDGAMKLTGHRSKELIESRGVVFADLIHEQDRDRVWREVQQAIEQGVPFAIDYRLVRADRRLIWVRERGVAVRDERGEVEALEGFIAETTPLVEAEQALRQSEERYREIFRQLPQQTYAWRVRGDDLYLEGANDAAQVATEGAIGERFGAAASEFYADTPEMVEDMLRCAHDGVVVNVERDYQYRTTAKVRRLAVTFSFVPPDLVLMHADDVTQQRETEEQLRASQKMDAIGRLAGGVAHDFNNLLTVINGYARFVTDELPADSALRADIVEIERAGERAATLTRQLLAFGRRQVLQPVQLSVNRIVRDMEPMLRRLIGEDIELQSQLADGLGTVEADPGQLEQVVMNITVNARDAMPRGGKLTIETKNVELDEAYAVSHVECSPGRYVQLAISDNGCGMDDVTRERIFEPFFTTKDKDKGTGLGMSTVYGIVKQSGGNIWVHSEPDVGTTFKIYLPRQAGPAAPARRSRVTSLTGGGETVLLVEDEQTVRDVTRRGLEGSGYRVLVAGCGKEALEIAERSAERIHLLLTDVVMPGINGKELAERLTAAYPRLRVLFMSGYSDEAVLHHGVLAREAHFITKPFSFEDLARRVRIVLEDGPG